MRGCDENAVTLGVRKGSAHGHLGHELQLPFQSGESHQTDRVG